MPTIDEAVIAAAKAIFRQSNVNLGNAPNDFDWEGAEQQCRDWNIALAKAALSAFLADAPVSEGMVEAGCAARHYGQGKWSDGMTEGVARIERIIAEKAIKAMSTKLAKEIQ